MQQGISMQKNRTASEEDPWISLGRRAVSWVFVLQERLDELILKAAPRLGVAAMIARIPLHANRAVCSVARACARGELLASSEPILPPSFFNPGIPSSPMDALPCCRESFSAQSQAESPSTLLESTEAATRQGKGEGGWKVG